MLLHNAQKYLEVVRKRGEARKELRRVYRILCCQGLYLMAYQNLYANKGALTPGIDPEDTVDTMSVERIDTIIDKLKRRTYEWKPTRRTYIFKRDGKSKRPLGLPGWTDKMLGEAIRLVLTAYYEPQFRESSHGFRPNRGCHTALNEIQKKWTGIKWFIKIDIRGCFDKLDHDVIIGILRRRIKDETFLKLMKGMLKAGYYEDWTYHQTYSGTPQGGIASPLLANIVLNELDTFIEDELIPKYTQGKERARNPEYQTLIDRARAAKKRGKRELYKGIRKLYQSIPSKLPEDPNFRRLKYVRYADDSLLGSAGTKAEAETIKRKIGEFLTGIRLEMSEDKTLITHALTEKTRFLNYEISVMQCDTWKTHGRRSANRHILFTVPKDVMQKWKAKVMKRNGIIHRKELMNTSDYDIVSKYEVELQGLIEYYLLAHDVACKMYKLRYIYGKSLVKTLAAKHKMKTTRVLKRYSRYTANGRRVIVATVLRKERKPLLASFGNKPITRKRNVIINDKITTIYNKHNELIERLLAEKCELCGRYGKVNGHHINKLKNLQKKKRELEEWEKRMIAIRRKSLFVCDECHQKIHNGTYDGKKLTQA